MTFAVESERKTPKQISRILSNAILVSHYDGTFRVQIILLKLVSFGLYAI